MVGDKDSASVIEPVLQVVRGTPSAEELAALVAVVSAVTAGAASSAAADNASAPRRSAWGDPGRTLRRPLSPGPDGWRGSARPVVLVLAVVTVIVGCR